MISAWTKHIKDPDEKAQFENNLRGCKRIFDRMSALLSEEESALDRSETDIKGYDNPSWSHKQAHKNGYRQALNLIQNLINLEDPKDKHDRQPSR